MDTPPKRFRRDPWTVPQDPPPAICPPGHPDSNCPIWLSPHTYRPSAGASVDIVSEMSGLVLDIPEGFLLPEDIARIYEVALCAVMAAIRVSGAKREKDRSVREETVVSLVAPILPPKGYLTKKEARLIIGYRSHSKLIDPELSTCQYELANHKFYEPSYVAGVKERVAERVQRDEQERKRFRHNTSKQSQKKRVDVRDRAEYFKVTRNERRAAKREELRRSVMPSHYMKLKEIAQALQMTHVAAYEAAGRQCFVTIKHAGALWADLADIQEYRDAQRSRRAEKPENEGGEQ